MWCIFLGFTELLIGQVVATIPKKILSKEFCRIGRGSIPQTSNARLLWIRSVTRLRHQVSAVKENWVCCNHFESIWNTVVYRTSVDIYTYTARTCEDLFITAHRPEHLNMCRGIKKNWSPNKHPIITSKSSQTSKLSHPIGFRSTFLFCRNTHVNALTL